MEAAGRSQAPRAHIFLCRSQHEVFEIGSPQIGNGMNWDEMMKLLNYAKNAYLLLHMISVLWWEVSDTWQHVMVLVTGCLRYQMNGSP